MLNLWWLLLIIPVALAVGFLGCLGLIAYS